KELAPKTGRNAGKISEEQLQQVTHPSRVHLIKFGGEENRSAAREILRLRREAEADFRFAGERTVRDPTVLAAMKRQVNNCALANMVWAAIKEPAGSAGGPTSRP